MEEEIRGHAKKAYKKWKDPKADSWHKVKEIALEVAIIVFAVSVSIWFHNMSETRHKRHDVKEFLVGIKEDLTGDIKEMEIDKASYAEQKATFNYIAGIKMNETINADSMDKHINAFFRTTELLPNDSRFEGFKSSGRIGTIENKVLQNDIMDLYQENIPMLLASTKHYLGNREHLNTFVLKNKKRLTDSTSNFKQIIVTDEARNICMYLTNTEEITERYQACINKEYGLK
jgi:hypothetical protein